MGFKCKFAQCCYMLNMKVVKSAASRLLTCWKESSNNVCLETVIFTWLGRAFDWGTHGTWNIIAWPVTVTQLTRAENNSSSKKQRLRSDLYSRKELLLLSRTTRLKQPEGGWREQHKCVQETETERMTPKRRRTQTWHR